MPRVFAESSHGSEEMVFSSRGSNLDSTGYDQNGIKLPQDGLPVRARSRPDARALNTGSPLPAYTFVRGSF